MLRGAAASDPDMAAGGHYSRQGEDRAWPHRLLIDHAKRLNGMRTVRLHPQESSYQLDDSRDSTRAVGVRALTQTSVEGRVHELVKEIAATLALETPAPPVSDTRAFEDYCKVVNAALAAHNFRDSHVFALYEPDSLEPDEVKQRLHGLLSNLRLFDCADADGDSSVLRVSRDELEAWYALHLHELSQRGLKVDPQLEPDQTPNENKPTEDSMNNPGHQTIKPSNHQRQRADRQRQQQHPGRQRCTDCPADYNRAARPGRRLDRTSPQ